MKSMGETAEIGHLQSDRTSLPKLREGRKMAVDQIKAPKQDRLTGC